MTGRRWIIASIATLGLVAAVLWCPLPSSPTPAPGVTKENIANLNAAMTMAHVTELLGSDPWEYEYNSLYYSQGDVSVSVYFDDEGFVVRWVLFTSEGMMPVVNTEKTWLVKALRWWRK